MTVPVASAPKQPKAQPAPPPVAAPPAPAPTKAAEGAPILLTTTEKMQSGETPEGSEIKFKVDRDVLTPDGQILIPAGGSATGKVVKSHGSGFFGRAGELNITVEEAKAVDGSYVPLRCARNATANDQETGVIVGAVLLSVFFVFMEGDDVTIPAGTLVTAYVRRDTTVKALPAKPGSNVARTAAMTLPTPGSKIKKDDKLIFSCSCQPDDADAYVRLYLDNTLIDSQKGSLAKMEWDTGRFEKVSQPGEHTVFAEITYASGQVVKTPDSKFTLVDD